mmetsp:Transcript_10234/g.21667  ORF Transcript_10234/g.21667 Transcript_10234/m.21667 type:complete len:469 (-) Transcript_10234:81-1487(-)
MSIEYQNSILWRGEDPLKKKVSPNFDASKKVVRYFPGKKPDWADKEEKAEEDVKQDPRARRRRGTVVEDSAISRLKRLQANDADGYEAKNERISRHRVIHEARVLEEGDEAKKEEDELDGKGAKLEEKEGEGKSSLAQAVGVSYDDVSGSEEEDNELRALRRERARELALLRRKEEEDVLKEEEEDRVGVGEDEEESEYETDSEDDDPRRGAMLKPVFVSKNQRDTVKEKEALAKEEEEAERKKEERKKERKVESKSLLVDHIRIAEEAEREGANENDASDIELIDDDDEKNEAEEYELWKIRELKRIKRDKEERLEKKKELEFIEKRRNMTDEERMADDKRLDDSSSKRDEAKAFNFLQKYYHRGGFFQDKAATGEESLYLRDYHEPLEEEKFDKQLLPKAMQLRRGQFGKKGQVKHTHLTEADTTDMGAAWASNSKQMQRYQEKMAAAKGVNNFDRPALSSKSKDL